MQDPQGANRPGQPTNRHENADSGAPRQIAVVTTGRADYGILTPVLRALEASPGTEPAVYATGTHLCERSGSTVNPIEADGWRIGALVFSEPESGDRTMAEKIARCTAGFGDAFAEHRPDVCVLLGDRYETLGAAVAASASSVPIAHIHGGEISTGALDNQFRYAITALANLHCVATAKARDRLIAMGEAPDAVIHTGAPGLDHLMACKPQSRDEFCAAVGFPSNNPFLLVTIHPETIAAADPASHADELVRALESLGMSCLVTAANQDPGGDAINAVLRDACARHGWAFADALGPLYHHAMHHAAAMVGNSSSGIIEAASFGLPVVNIGDRQQGRERSGNVIDCAHDADAITNAVRAAITMDVTEISNVYAAPPGTAACERIAEAVAAMSLSGDILKKRFEPPGLE